MLVDCSQKPRKTEADAGSKPITQEQAIAIISALPEIKAWAKYVAEKTARNVPTTLMVEPEKPQNVAESKYWSVGFYESQPTHVHRWQTFLVRLDGKEILVDDLITGDYLDLEKWREKEKPLERVRESKIP